MRGKKSRGESVLAQVTVERTLVWSMPRTTDPFAKRAIFPVSKETTRDPTSNSSLKDSKILVPAEAGESGLDGAKPRRPEQMVRKPKARHARKLGRDVDLARFTIDDIIHTQREWEMWSREREREGERKGFNAPVRLRLRSRQRKLNEGF